MATLVTHSLTHSFTYSLTNSVLLSRLIDVTLACEDANSKLVGVVTVADVNAEDRWQQFVADLVAEVWS